jgi:hypothetical protein
MIYEESFLEKVRSFGILGYSVDKIIDLAEPDNIEQFISDFDNPESEVYRAYRKGKTTGDYNMDRELFDKSTKAHDLAANEVLKNRKQHNKINDLIFSKFGI